MDFGHAKRQIVFFFFFQMQRRSDRKAKVDVYLYDGLPEWNTICKMHYHLVQSPYECVIRYKLKQDRLSVGLQAVWTRIQTTIKVKHMDDVMLAFVNK